jgi:hypothetical protein
MNTEKNMPAEMLEKIEVQKPSHEEVAVAAYYIWLSEGCPEGCAERHWYEAEMQLLRMRQAEALEKMKSQTASCQSSGTGGTKPESTPANPAVNTEKSGEKKEESAKPEVKKKKSASSAKKAKKSAK